MLQSFAATSRPDQGPPRLEALRHVLARAGLQGFIVPRADAHQGEYVAACDERLAWLTGFTGSAGLAVVLPDVAGVFADGRYRLQLRAQVDLGYFTPVDWPATKPGDWLRAHLPAGGAVGFDPWLHTRDEIGKLEEALAGSGVELRRSPNMVDAIWADRPIPPGGAVMVHDEALAGESAKAKRDRIAEMLRKAGQRAGVLTLPDSICWLLNIRGADVPRVPLLDAFAIVHDDGRVALFADGAKFGAEVRAHLGAGVNLRPVAAFGAALRTLAGPVRVDGASAPVLVGDELDEGGVAIAWAQDPCILPKARKNEAELAGTRAAHLRDGAAMVRFLTWLDENARTGGLTEIDAVQQLERFRQDTGALHDISFDTIAGSGPHGAIVHYRVTHETNRALAPGELFLIDSGGQYRDGTTDVTRTIAIGAPPQAARAAFTRVLRGMIAISRLRWPEGLAGRDLDALARYPLWLAGQDYDHGTGHGVGVFLSVHEGPQRLSRISEVPLEPGMILSNEPGYYREGAFGIRLENLVAVCHADALPEGDAREMLAFETLTWVPIDRSLIEVGDLSAEERAWLDSYHAGVRTRIMPLLDGDPAAAAWLESATRPV